MSEDSKHQRTWQEIAAEACQEQDPARLIELTEELERALDERDKLPAEPDKPTSKSKAA